MSNSAQRGTKNERRQHAREQARLMREKQRQSERRRRFFIQGGVGLAIIAIAVIVTVVIVQNNANSVVAASTSSGPPNMRSDGALFHGVNGKATIVPTAALKPKENPVPTDTKKLTSTANIVEYIDLQCPYCQEFVETNLADEEKWVDAGKATIEIHPIAILDASSEGTRYSSRAANMAACVAANDPSGFFPMLQTFYKNQPAEGTSGLTNSKMISLLAGVGITSKKVIGCVNGETYKNWVTRATSTVQASGFDFPGVASKPTTFQGTPEVFVNGVQYTGSLTDASAFTSFVNEQKPGTAS